MPIYAPCKSAHNNYDLAIEHEYRELEGPLTEEPSMSIHTSSEHKPHNSMAVHYYSLPMDEETVNICITAEETDKNCVTAQETDKNFSRTEDRTLTEDIYAQVHKMK